VRVHVRVHVRIRVHIRVHARVQMFARVRVLEFVRLCACLAPVVAAR